MTRIYISYAMADRAFARQLAGELARLGGEIASAPRPGDAIVILLSPEALASPDVPPDLDPGRVQMMRLAGSMYIAVMLRPVDANAIPAGAPVLDAVGRLPEEVARDVLARVAEGAPRRDQEERVRGITDTRAEDIPTTPPLNDVPAEDERVGGYGGPPAPKPAPEPPAPPAASGEPVPAGQPKDAPTPPSPVPIPYPSVEEQYPAQQPGAPYQPSTEAVSGTIAGELRDRVLGRGRGAGRERVGGPARGARRETASDEPLEFSAFHPSALPVETWNTLLVYAHVDATLAAIEADAATFTELGSAPRTARGRATRAVARGAELIVEPHMDGVSFSPASDTFVWHGGWHRSLFRFRAEAALAGSERAGWVDIYSGPMVPIARIELSFPFHASRATLATTALPKGRVVTSSIHDTVFISYSHRDREAFRQACDEYQRYGIGIYTDEQLEAGADYEHEIERMIARARVFHLLWSQASAASGECRKEWAAALQREPTERFIKPWYWRHPLTPPPTEFAQHHISFRFQRLRRKLLKPGTWL